MLQPSTFPRFTRPRARSALTTTAPLLIILACLSCASSGPRGPVAPPADAPTVGEGECWVEVANRSSGRLELYYWIGMGDPPPNPRGWETVGFIPVGRTLVVRAPCDQIYVHATGYLLGTENPTRRDITLSGRERLSNTRRATIRLRDRR